MTMYERQLVSRLTKRLSEPRRFLQVITGPRQTGKTTALTQALAKLPAYTHFISTDDPILSSQEWLRNEWELARHLARSKEVILAIDEVQKIKDCLRSSSSCGMRIAGRKSPLKSF